MRLDAVKHAGKAHRAALRLIYWTLVGLLALALGGALAKILGNVIVEIAGLLFALWLLFGLFCLYFFRDPTPVVSSDPKAITAPAFGKVDAIDEIEESEFMGGRCKRVSIFLSVFDVHIQYAPLAGRVSLCKHNPGQFLNAMSAESATHNENVLIGFESAEVAGEKIGVRLIAGLIARRIIPWVAEGETLGRAERISLIQFGSRVDVYLPLASTVEVTLGQRVRGSETVLARRS